MRLGLPALSLWVALGLPGCHPPKELADVVSPAKWSVVPPERDPYDAFRPGPDACPPTAFGLEDLGGEPTLGINAQDCAYVTLEQPALAEVERGDLVHIRIWHFQLVALEASTATMALTIDGRTILEREIPIPSPSELLSPRFTADFDAPAGANIVFHVRNHGSNSYNLIELSRGGEE